MSASSCDPDRNHVEFQVDTRIGEEENEFMRSPVFATNPIGVEVDVDALVTRRAAGGSIESRTASVPSTR